jgi:hypothetical protein
MSVAVRPADISADAGQIVKLLTAHVNPRYDHARFDWLYRHNPAGVAHAWLAHDTTSGEVVGTAAAIPRQVQLGDRHEVVWVLGDFCVADAYRALGPAVQLQRACIASVTSGEVPFCYDFPGAAMTAVYARLRIRPFAQMRRLAYPLRVDSHLGDLPLPPPIRRVFTAAGNAVLHLRARPGRGTSRLTCELLPGRCGTEFSELAARYSAQHGLCIQRSADYLNWRFLDNPFRQHQILTARDYGELVAYAVLAPDADSLAIVDLFGPLERDAAIVLAMAAVGFADARRARVVTISLPDCHAWLRELVAQGFRLRETHPVMVYAPRDPYAQIIPPLSSRCLLTQGDRDS